jgi:hypothetical protein
MPSKVPPCRTYLLTSWTHLKSAHKKRRKHDKILWLIGAGKIFYGLVLLAVGIGAFNLIGKNLSAELWHLIQVWNVDFHNRYIQMLFRKVSAVDGQKLYFLTIVTFAYGLNLFVSIVPFTPPMPFPFVAPLFPL